MLGRRSTTSPPRRAPEPAPRPRCDRAGRNTRRVARPVRRSGVQEIRDVLRAETPTHLFLRSRLLFVGGATIVIDAVASVLILLFEKNADGTHITNFGDSVFWTTTQLLTVSSQLPNPISTPARVLDVFLQFWAISVVAVLAGSFGAFFQRRGWERHPMGPPG
jgi:hypothetical protein